MARSDKELLNHRSLNDDRTVLLIDSLHELQDAFEALYTEHQRLSADFREANQRLKEADAIMHTLEESSKRERLLVDELTDLRRAVRTSTDQNKDLRARLSSASSELEELRTENEQLRNDSAKKFSTTTQENSLLLNELDKVQVELERAHQTNNVLISVIDDSANTILQVGRSRHSDSLVQD